MKHLSTSLKYIIFILIVGSMNMVGVGYLGRLQAQSLQLKIIGPPLIQSPNQVSYSVQINQIVPIFWMLKSTHSSIVGNNTGLNVNIDFQGRGVDTLIVRAANTASLEFDTLYIKKNTCPAISGLLPTNTFVCRGSSTILRLDTLQGQVLSWERAFQANNWIPFPFSSRELLTGPVHQDAFYRAIVAIGTCRDTSNVGKISMVPFPEGGLIAGNDTICSGELTTPLGGKITNGTGFWTTSGSGTFLDPNAPNTQYRSSPTDSGVIFLRWNITNPPCEPLIFSTGIFVRPLPKGAFNQNLSPVCPGDTTFVLQAQTFYGNGKWETPNGKGRFLNPFNPNTRYISAYADAGKSIQLQWVVSTPECGSQVYTQPLFVQATKISNIIFPFKPDTTVCFGNELKLQAEVFTGSYTWITSLPIKDPNTRSPTITVNTNGQVILRTIDVFSNCITFDTLNIFVKPAEILFTKDTTICKGISVQLTTNVQGGNLSWQPNLEIDNPNRPNPNVNPSESRTYVLQRSFQNCVTIGNFRVNVLPTEAPTIKPSIQTENFIGFCQGYPAALNNLNYNCKKTYWFYASEELIKTQNIIDPINGNLRRNIILMNDSTLFLDSQAIPFSTSWNLNINTETTDTLTVCAACWADDIQCVGYSSMTFRILERPLANFELIPASGSLKSDSIPYGNRSVTFRNLTPENPNVFYTYIWDFGDPQSGLLNNSQDKNPTHNFTGAGRYNITLVASNGACGASKVSSLTVLPERYYFPTAFSPNGDGDNDIFRPIPAFWDGSNGQIESIDVKKITIFNRWNRPVFETTDTKRFQNSWNGTSNNGDKLESGVYFYQFEIQHKGVNQVQLYQGYINLMR